MMYSKLCIFTPYGSTYTFRDVNVTQDDQTVLEFKYLAMSDRVWKIATFYKSNIVGWSTTVEEDETG